VPPPVATFTPDPEAARAAAEAYARYRRLVAQLAPLAIAPWYLPPDGDVAGA
jgi:hypothetical protein